MLFVDVLRYLLRMNLDLLRSEDFLNHASSFTRYCYCVLFFMQPASFFMRLDDADGLPE